MVCVARMIIVAIFIKDSHHIKECCECSQTTPFTKENRTDVSSSVHSGGPTPAGHATLPVRTGAITLPTLNVYLRSGASWPGQ